MNLNIKIVLIINIVTLKQSIAVTKIFTFVINLFYMSKILFFLLLPIISFSQIPAYYQGVDFTKTGNDLKDDLHQLMIQTHHTYMPYTATNADDAWTVLRIADLNNDGSNNVLLIYGFNDDDGNFQTDRTRDKMSTCHTSSCEALWNREHVYPRSLGTPNLGFDLAGADLHNLRACDAFRNSSRGNKRFGDAQNTPASYSLSPNSYYPGEEWRGDIARIIMYMYLRYPTQCLPTAVGDGAATHSYDMPNVFLKWNAEDPVSIHEMTRNNVIYSYQGNRNPFIDNPYMATIIWGGQNAEDRWNTLNTTATASNHLNLFPTITSDFVYIDDATQTYTFNVFNTLGQNIQTVTNQNKIDLSVHPQGLYFIQVKNEQTIQNFKVILR